MPPHFHRFCDLRACRRTPILTLVLLVLASIVGCQPPASQQVRKGTETPPPSTPAKLRLAVIPKGTTHEFWKSVHFGAEQAAKEFDFPVEIDWLGPQLENDRDGQITIVQNFVTSKVNGIVLAPLDSQALVASVAEANDAGIPVVIFDSGLDDASIVVSYVATDNFHGGELAAEEMARRLNGQGNVIMLRYTPGSESTEQREEGFLKKLSEYPEIEVISSDQYAGTTPESSLDKAQQVINKFEGKFDGVFAVCEPNARGVFGALKEAELSDKVQFIGFDPSPDMVNAMADGKMQGIVLQDPVQMGYLAVKTIVEHLQGKTVETRVRTGEYLATPENMKEERMQELLNPKQFGE